MDQLTLIGSPELSVVVSGLPDRPCFALERPGTPSTKVEQPKYLLGKFVLVRGPAVRVQDASELEFMRTGALRSFASSLTKQCFGTAATALITEYGRQIGCGAPIVDVPFSASKVHTAAGLVVLFDTPKKAANYARSTEGTVF